LFIQWEMYIEDCLQCWGVYSVL